MTIVDPYGAAPADQQCGVPHPDHPERECHRQHFHSPHAIDMPDGTRKLWLDTYTGAARTWSLPAEPGPEVTAVRCGCWPCRLIQPWRRRNGEWYASTPEPAQHGLAWRWLVHDHGPLVDATGEQS